jgi:hypothetical protein
MNVRALAAFVLLALTAACTPVSPTASETPDPAPARSSGGMGSGH